MKLLFYCTKEKEIWGDGSGNTWWGIAPDEDIDLVFELNPTLTRLNGKIVAECEIDKVEEIILNGDETELKFGTKSNDCIEEQACLNFDELEQYFGYKNEKWGYALYLKNLKVFNTPFPINTYLAKVADDPRKSTILRKAPRNMCYCYDMFEEKHILISIRPEHLCKILNGEKTIEVRKQILKELKREVISNDQRRIYSKFE